MFAGGHGRLHQQTHEGGRTGDGPRGWAPCNPPKLPTAAAPDAGSADLAVDPLVLANLKGMAEATDPALFDQIVESFLHDSPGPGAFAARGGRGCRNAGKTAHAIKGMCVPSARSALRYLPGTGDPRSGRLPRGVLHLDRRLTNEFRRAESELSPQTQVAFHMNILLADDNPTFRLILGGLLKKLGHEVKAVDSGLQAWYAFQEAYYPVLITDWQMPEMDGMQLMKRVRARPYDQYTYVIMVASKGGKESYLEAMRPGGRFH